MDVFSNKGSIKVLDVGCGTGVFEKNLNKLNQFNLDTSLY